jgi:hypothetical protein
VLVGPIGTGKTHLATALGIEAIKRGHHVLFFRASDLVRALTEDRSACVKERGTTPAVSREVLRPVGHESPNAYPRHKASETPVSRLPARRATEDSNL